MLCNVVGLLYELGRAGRWFGNKRGDLRGLRLGPVRKYNRRGTVSQFTRRVIVSILPEALRPSAIFTTKTMNEADSAIYSINCNGIIYWDDV